jgi:hypothetical protein
MPSIGEVRTCGHCEGSGYCSGGVGTNSCLKCAKAAGDTLTGANVVICSACGGKGAVWIRPDIVQIQESKD